MIDVRSLSAQCHVTVQEEQGHVNLWVEDEAETFPIRRCVKDTEVRLRIDSDRVIRGAHCLNESVVWGLAGVGVGRDEARYDGEAQIWVWHGWCDLKHKRERGKHLFFKYKDSQVRTDLFMDSSQQSWLCFFSDHTHCSYIWVYTHFMSTYSQTHCFFY